MQHYYSEHQKSPLKIKKISLQISGVGFNFYASSGVFSKNKADKGTLLLADNMSIENGFNVLDVGCGIGILGIAAAKLFNARVSMSEINERAVMLAKKNVKLNNVIADVFHGNLYEQIQKHDFDVILSNPPQTAGKELCFQLIWQSRNYLKNNGSLQLVARRNKGGITLSEKMKEVFGNVKVIAKKSGYWVYRSVKN